MNIAINYPGDGRFFLYDRQTGVTALLSAKAFFVWGMLPNATFFRG